MHTLGHKETEELSRLLEDVRQSDAACILACKDLAKILLHAGDVREDLHIFVREHCADEGGELVEAVNSAAHDTYDLRRIITEEAVWYIDGLKGRHMPIAEIVELLTKKIKKQQQAPFLRVVKK